MRHITIILLLIANICTAQTWPKDSSWSQNENGVYFEYRQITQQDGSFDLKKLYIGNDTTLAAQKTAQARNQSAVMANDAKAVAPFRQRVTETIRQRDATRTQIGIDFLRPLQDEVSPSLTGELWEIKSDTLRNVTFAVNAQGVLRYSIPGFNTRQAHVVGSDVMRLERYLGTSEHLDLFRDGNRWRSLNGAIVLRRRGSTDR